MNPRLRIPLMLGGVAAAVALGLYWWFRGGRFQETDDAYVQMTRIAISTNVPGRVSEIDVRENQAVRKGQILFRLDEAPFRIAVEEAQAHLAAMRLQVAGLKADLLRRDAEVLAARSAEDFAERDLERANKLLAPGIVTQSQVEQAVHARDDARAKGTAARQQRAAAAAALAGDANLPVERHPAVQQAQAQLDRARLELSYATVAAPADGVVARVDALQPGSYVSAAAPLFALVVAGDLWVEANFKEDQLTHLRPGQPATVSVDSYPGVEFAAHVSGVSPGTGSQFSLLPAENASGNWVKVVQRLPVRLTLDHVDPAYPLQGGLSASVRVDTGYRRQLFGSGTATTPLARAGR